MSSPRAASCARCGGELYVERQGFDLEAYWFDCGAYAGDVVNGVLQPPGSLTIEHEIEAALAAGAPRCVDCGTKVDRKGGRCGKCAQARREVRRDTRPSYLKKHCRDCGVEE